MKAPRESDILKACLQLLAMRGVVAWRHNQGAIPLEGGGYRRFVGARGCSDILGVLPGGRFLACEVKRPGKKPTADQLGFLAAVNAAGGLGVWVQSVDELDRKLEAL